MKEKIPVNSDVLRWARTTLDISVEDVASRFKKAAAEIEAWEAGEASPTYAQLEKLAYEIYKRPIAIFFFPHPPEEEKIEQTFRTLPEYELDRIPPRIRKLLRTAKVLQANVEELYEGKNPATRHILDDLEFSTSVSVVQMAKQVREYLGIELHEQINWKDARLAFNKWREILEDNGIFVFKDNFDPRGKKKTVMGKSSFSGFCLYDDRFPVIYVNNGNPKTRQIFTLFHELSHLLMRTGGIDTRRDDYIEHMSGENKKIEILCNRFAGEFLVPEDDFTLRISEQNINDDIISDWADIYCVSREVIARKLLDRNLVSKKYYEQKAEQWKDEHDRAVKRRKEKSKGGPTYFQTKGSYLGERYVDAVFSHYHRGKISTQQAADYLVSNPRNVPGMEQWLLNRGGAV